MMAAPAINQDYHIHFEDIEVFVKSFKLTYVRNLTGKDITSATQNAYYEETKGTSSLFTVEVLLHWLLRLSSLFIFDLAFSRIML